jgi:hypothetical protein
MKPKPDQDVSRRNAVQPLFSGELPVSVLPTPPKQEQFTFSDQDRKAVEEVLKHDADSSDDASG